jgi:hypothetical protein
MIARSYRFMVPSVGRGSTIGSVCNDFVRSSSVLGAVAGGLSLEGGIGFVPKPKHQAFKAMISSKRQFACCFDPVLIGTALRPSDSVAVKFATNTSATTRPLFMQVCPRRGKKDEPDELRSAGQAPAVSPNVPSRAYIDLTFMARWRDRLRFSRRRRRSGSTSRRLTPGTAPPCRQTGSPAPGRD